jgi:phospholipid/cholesterol/gamma-HCH transport system permease protein
MEEKTPPTNGPGVAPVPPEAAPRISLAHAPDVTDLAGRAATWRLTGRWTAAQLARPLAWRRVTAELLATSPAADPAPAWDLRHLQSLDHTGVQLLWNHWGRQWPDRVHLLPAQRAMFERVARYTLAPSLEAPQTGAQKLTGLLLARFEDLGDMLFRLFDHLSDLLRLVGQLLLDSVQLCRRPARGPWRDVSGHIFRIGATAMPITALVGFLVGVVLAYLVSQQLRQFGADAFIVDLLGISLIRELGPVLAAILIAGRSGSAITAQIGVMRVTEELDAMQVMGIRQGFRLVMPRAMALALAMPLITVWTTVAALAGGMLASDLVIGITPAFFANALPSAVQVSNLTLAVGKSVVFGVLIAVIGCHYGLRVKPNTESLGEGTTASVVTSITVVILVDALFAVVFKDVGI